MPHPKETETSFMAAVVMLAKLSGWLCYHTFDSRRSEPGYPDLHLVRNGEQIFAELKLPGKKPTAAQIKWVEALKACACEVYVWTPEHWPFIEERLGKKRMP